MRSLPLVLLLALVSRAAAQAPVVTPRGDPSVRSDTIYRLAVDPAAYPDEPYVVLLDDGVVRWEADGRGTRTYRQVIQVLKQEAAEEFGEQVFSYSRHRERLTINWLRVVRPDGTVISDSAMHEQETDAPAVQEKPEGKPEEGERPPAAEGQPEGQPAPAPNKEPAPVKQPGQGDEDLLP